MKKQWTDLNSRLFIGILLFWMLVVLYLAVLILTRGPEATSFAVLCKWDCGWYQAIIRNGYVSTLPPIAQAEDQANVAFFPLYPMLGAAVSSLLGVSSAVALPLVSAIFAFGTYLILPFLATREDGRPSAAKLALIAAFPATFYLFVGYSESTYCFFLFLGLLLLKNRDTLRAPLLYGGILLAGVALGLTRLTGFIIPGVAFAFSLFRPKLRNTALAWTLGSVAGAGLFFLYCHLKFGVWNLYFQTVAIGWNKEFSLPGMFRLFWASIPLHFNSPRFFNDPVQMSRILVLDTFILYSYALIRARGLGRILLGGGLAHLFITTGGDSGTWHQWMNGMRYVMPAFFLIVILWEKEWTPKILERHHGWKRALVILLALFWLPYQLYYLYLYSLKIWVS